MKVAICLTGIHYMNSYTHWMNWKIAVDYRKSVQSFKDCVESYFKKQGYEVDYFLATYNSTLLSELVDIFSPCVRFFAEPFPNDYVNTPENAAIGKHRKLEQVISCLTDEYDMYLFTRFDLNYTYSLDTLRVDFDKVNFHTRMKKFYTDHDVDDNFILVPQKYLNKFIEAVKKHPKNMFLHNIMDYLNADVNYFIDGEYYSHEFKFFYSFAR